jgi:D-alanyl-D-alanine carboxypeptidase
MPAVSRRSVLTLAAATVLAAGLDACASGPQPLTTSSTNPSGSGPAASPSLSPSVSPSVKSSADTFDKKARSIDNPASLWVVVNKRRPLNPIDYAPADLVTVPVPYQNKPMLRKEASNAVVSMFAAAAAEGAGGMQSQSAYRSYSTQVSVYNGWVSSLSKTKADMQSARPGTSEHQTGLAIDISPVPLKCALEACFGDTPQGKWLAANSYRFGFILRYVADKTAVTGYIYEPWHFRYVGIDLATEMHKTGITTLEEFFGLPAAPNYPS